MIQIVSNWDKYLIMVIFFKDIFIGVDRDNIMNGTYH